MKNITSVINFCTYDFRLLNACVSAARLFSDEILITVCDHFFDGSEENYGLLEYVYKKFYDCRFIEYRFDPIQSYRLFSPHNPEHHNWRHEWQNTGRWISYYFLSPACELIFFLDTDEIIEGKELYKWLEVNSLDDYSALSFSAYWYFREAKYQATRWDDISLLVRKKDLRIEYLWDSDERAGILIQMNGKKLYHIKGLDQRPLVHHYSWVRTKQELHKKFATWGHHWERPWHELLDTAFSKDFSGKDFIRGYTYQTVEPYFDPLATPLPQVPPISLEQHEKNVQFFPNVIKVDRKYMQRKELMQCLK